MTKLNWKIAYQKRTQTSPFYVPTPDVVPAFFATVLTFAALFFVGCLYNDGVTSIINWPLIGSITIKTEQSTYYMLYTTLLATITGFLAWLCNLTYEVEAIKLDWKGVIVLRTKFLNLRDFFCLSHLKLTMFFTFKPAQCPFTDNPVIGQPILGIDAWKGIRSETDPIKRLEIIRDEVSNPETCAFYLYREMLSQYAEIFTISFFVIFCIFIIYSIHAWLRNGDSLIALVCQTYPVSTFFIILSPLFFYVEWVLIPTYEPTWVLQYEILKMISDRKEYPGSILFLLHLVDYITIAVILLIYFLVARGLLYVLSILKQDKKKDKKIN